ncbi:hypothetical protein BX616_009462 [Lobosporangium transversale]|uniref:F-box domain-containing protein n=1 Tax=Lobosporangium transversale TaxID=64571 RepID=A0A1Y2GFS8_9FUNG|nr:hypothetical protein BCR41DRAFT_358232 [Lobosporangium transversale]KAF9913846.1 hypothetical protein BX616_009462 [Lobosporangium transversale]ORZ09652.1 hypothetical protein BCR41DRAFT_358232 [Lobosporangium transversale]|eukprot:XP_021878922.1 hypothetical protein BCR41DRAFT_358232 [Lobosporangium transversale]
MKLHPFDIPEVLDKIVFHLKRRDILSCIYVSKPFHRAFIKFLWRSISVTPWTDWHSLGSQELDKYKHYIESIFFVGCFPENILSLRGCGRLRSLAAKSGDTQHFEDIQSSFSNLMIANSSTLRECKIEAYASTLRLCSSKAALQCFYLKELELDGFVVQTQEIDLFFQMCSQLKVLKLTNVDLQWPFGGLMGAFGSNTEVAGSQPGVALSISAPTIRNVQKLTLFQIKVLGCSPRSEAHDLAVLVRSCPELRSLKLMDDLGQDEALDFCRTLTQDPWPLPCLESLDISDVPLEDEDLATLLAKMNQLQQLYAWESEFGPLCLSELLKSRSSLDGGGRLCDTVEMLTVISLNSEYGIVQTIMSSCKHLITLRSGEITVTEIVEGKEWVCSKLKKLDVDLIFDGADGESEERKAKQQKVFGHLGKLTKLQNLQLTGVTASIAGTRTLDLRLESGLDKLVGLKQLRCLVFCRESHWMGLEEAIWMVENWPCLMRVIGPEDRDPDIDKSIADIFNRNGISYG